MLETLTSQFGAIGSASLVPRTMTVLLLISISIASRELLILSGQTWIKTFAHTATITLLPLVTLCITSIISGNIALSLGMIGALSIVRFRNPVRSPFELAVYFTAITLGIAASVSIKWVLFLTGSVALALLALKILEVVSLKFLKRDFFASSFSEGNSMSTLHISSSDYIDPLACNKLVSTVSSSGENYEYVLVSADWRELQNVLEVARSSHDVKHFNLNK